MEEERAKTLQKFSETLNKTGISLERVNKAMDIGTIASEKFVEEVGKSTLTLDKFDEIMDRIKKSPEHLVVYYDDDEDLSNKKYQIKELLKSSGKE